MSTWFTSNISPVSWSVTADLSGCAGSWHDLVSFQHESFIHGIAASLCFVSLCLHTRYYLANGILFIEQYFQIKITICNMYSIIPEAWNIQACKCLTDTVAYTWWCCWRRRIFFSLPEYSRVLHNVCMTSKHTQCVTCKVYWKVHVPYLRSSGLNRKCCKVKFHTKYL